MAPVSDPLLPSLVTHYWFQFTVPLMCVQIMAESGRDGMGGGVGRARVRPLQFLHPLMATVSYTLDNDDVCWRTNRGISLNGAPVDGR